MCAIYDWFSSENFNITPILYVKSFHTKRQYACLYVVEDMYTKYEGDGNINEAYYILCDGKGQKMVSLGNNF
jgi:hypothetical protein